jgi:hypothetical protein
MQRTSVNAGLCIRLCLNLFSHSETAIRHLNVVDLTAAMFKQVTVK